MSVISFSAAQLLIVIAMLLSSTFASARTYIWRSTLPFQADFVQGRDAVSVCKRISEFWNSTSQYNVTATRLGTPNQGGLANDCIITYASSGQFAFINNSNMQSVGMLFSLFLSAKEDPESEPAEQCKANNTVADPINPANGAVIKSAQDCASRSGMGSLDVQRFYSSVDTADHGLGIGWRRGLSRSIAPIYHTYKLGTHIVGDPDLSSLYDDETDACVSGFAEIQSQVAPWVGAVATFENSQCVVRKNGVYVTTLPLHYNAGGLPAPLPTLMAYEITRDDGQVIRFWSEGGVLRSAPGMSLRLTQTVSGFELRDNNDNVETYDANGRLLSITSRAGVTQTMYYDASGRLSNVTDSFGHTLAISYDSQNRMIVVTRP